MVLLLLNFPLSSPFLGISLLNQTREDLDPFWSLRQSLTFLILCSISDVGHRLDIGAGQKKN
jgi:hypothetical protein